MDLIAHAFVSLDFDLYRSDNGSERRRAHYSKFTIPVEATIL